MDAGPRRIFDVGSAPRLQESSLDRSSSAAWRYANGCGSSLSPLVGWSVAVNAVSKRPALCGRSRGMPCRLPAAEVARPSVCALPRGPGSSRRPCAERAPRPPRRGPPRAARRGRRNAGRRCWGRPRPCASPRAARPRPDPPSARLHASLDERRPHSAAGARSPAPRPIARLRVTCGALIACWHFAGV